MCCSNDVDITSQYRNVAQLFPLRSPIDSLIRVCIDNIIFALIAWTADAAGGDLPVGLV